MNKEEIKEILDNIFKDENVNGFILSDERYKELKDYITNLQQEIERLNNIINTFEEDLENMKMNLRYSGTKWDNDCLIRAEVIKQVLDKLKELKESGNNE
jgi:predicted  nucleic acid-binding Zn-ribbon protein